MVEIFPNVSEQVRQQAKFWVDLALQQKNLYTAARMVSEYANSCFNDEEKDFVDFYFKMRLEELTK